MNAWQKISKLTTASLIILSLGTIVSIVIFLLIQQQQIDAWRHDFELESKKVALLIKKQVSSLENDLRGVVSFYNSSKHVDRAEFKIYTKPIYKHSSSIKAVEWIPKIQHSERKKYEKLASQELGQKYQFMQLTESNQIKKAKSKSVYFPIYYVEPISTNQALLGFDLASNPNQMQELQSAQDSGNTIIFERDRLKEIRGNSQDFLHMLLPIYSSKKTPNTTKERQEKLAGFILGVYSIRELVSNAIVNNSQTGINLLIYKDELTQNNLVHGSSVDSPFFEHQQGINLFNKKWIIKLQGDKRFDGGRSFFLAALIACFIFFAAFLMAVTVQIILRRNRTIRETVDIKTKEIQESNERLINEVRERKTAEQKAASATKAKSAFLATMSHEIRTPLNGIIGFTELLQGSKLPEDAQSKVNLIRECSEGLLEILNDILDFSKIEAGKLKLESTPVDIRKLTESCHAIFRESAAKKSIQLTIEIDKAVPKLFSGDSLRIRQILFNLIGNAIKFTEKGHVKLQISAKDFDSANNFELIVSVEDTGIGISEKAQANLFQSFMQADSSTTRKFGGSGLGLAICLALVEMMKGKIWLESELDKGSTFYFSLNSRVLAAKSDSNTQMETLETPSLDKSISILIAEDNKVNQMLLAKLLEKLGYQNVTIVDNGAEAVQHCKTNFCDLIFMDIQMPIMDGIQATETIRKDKGIDSELIIIGLSANIFPEDKFLVNKSQMSEFIEKPINLKKLVKALQPIKSRHKNAA